ERARIAASRVRPLLDNIRIQVRLRDRVAQAVSRNQDRTDREPAQPARPLRRVLECRREALAPVERADGAVEATEERRELARIESVRLREVKIPVPSSSDFDHV